MTINSLPVNGFLLHHGHTIPLPLIPSGLNDRRQVAGYIGSLPFPSFQQAFVIGNFPLKYYVKIRECIDFR